MERATIVHIILPLKLNKPYSYLCTLDTTPLPGMRVEVPLRKKHYTGIVWSVSTIDRPQTDKLTKVIRILDPTPILNARYKAFWDWISTYYCCTLGELMRAAIPAGYRLESEYFIQVED